MKRTLNRCLSAAVVAATLAAPAAAQEASRDWATLDSSLRPGTRVELDLADGTHVEGTVLGQDGEQLVFSPRTRVPVVPWRVAYSELRSVDIRHHDGMRPGTKVLLGIGIGAGVFLIIGGILAAMSS
jgi:hypothetical protein